MKQKDVRAVVDMALREPTREQEARALQLCIRHLIRDAENLGFADVRESLEYAASAIDAALLTENGGA